MQAMRALSLIVLVVCLPLTANAQEIEPYSYAPSPVGANFAVAAIGETWGDILFDPSLPITDVRARWHTLAIGYGRTFGLFGRSANFGMAFPYVNGDVSGKVNEVSDAITRTGLADPRFRVSVNLLGAPALTPAEFAVYEQKTTLGLTFIVAPPAGRYFPDKLINLGSNRWSFKSELGLSHPVNRWRWELAAGVWVFTDNNDFFNGQTREQRPIATFQGHVIYTFRPRFWLAVDANWYRGGTTVLDGVANADLQSTARYGLTIAYPINPQHSIKASYSNGATTRIGGDFQQIGVLWQYAWF